MSPNKSTPHSEQLTHPKYRADIDGLRAIAVLSVVGFHAFPEWIRGGFIGVDIFFIISGYLITSIIFDNLKKERFSFIEFYSRRIRRIFPALLLVLIACYVCGWFVLLASEFAQLGKHIEGASWFVSNFVLWNESGYFDNASDTKPLLHLWSLAIEEQFYIVWPLLIWLAWKRKINFLVVTLLILMASFAINAATISSHPIATFYSPLSRFWELLVGSALAYVTLYRQDIKRNFNARYPNLLSGLGIALIVIGIAILNKQSAFPGWWALLPTLGAVLIISSDNKAWLNQKVLSNKVMVWFGLISYPLYLWHWPLLSFGQVITAGKLPDSYKVILVVLAITLAFLTYQLWEKLLRHKGNKVAFTLLLTVLAIGCAGWSIHARQGLEFRYRKMMTFSDVMKRDFTKWEDKNMYPTGTCTPGFIYPEAHICLQSKPAADADTIVFGDSHAFHAYWGIAKSFGEQGHVVKLIGKGGCPFFLYHPDQASDRVCLDTFKEQLDWIIKTPKVKYVFIVHRNAISNQSPTDDVISYSALIDKTLDALSRSGKEITYLMSNPEVHLNPRLCTGKLPLGRVIDKESCTFPLSRELKLQQTYRTALSTILGKYPAVKVYDPANLLCQQGTCQVIQNGRTMWMDDNHISESASYLQGTAIVNVLFH
ncbi:MAG TPA: acyltransferase family protein [Burkholderiaceae bacterium]|jgi:peptidoglycan/LPS O-acetylase OafA/YrhL